MDNKSIHVGDIVKDGCSGLEIYCKVQKVEVNRVWGHWFRHIEDVHKNNNGLTFSHPNSCVVIHRRENNNNEAIEILNGFLKEESNGR